MHKQLGIVSWWVAALAVAAVAALPVAALWVLGWLPAEAAWPALAAALLLGALVGLTLGRSAARSARLSPSLWTAPGAGDELAARAGELIGDLDRLVGWLLQEVSERWGAQRVALIWHRPDETPRWSLAQPAVGLEPAELDDLKARVARAGGELAALAAARGSDELLSGPLASMPGEEFALLAPMRGADGLVGLLRLANPAGGARPNPADVALLEEAAGGLAPLLAAAQRLDSTQRRLEEMALLYELGAPLAGELDFDQVVTNALAIIRDKLNVEQVGLFLVDESSETLTLHRADPAVSDADARILVALGAGLIGRVAQSGQGEIVNGGQDRPALLATRQAELCVPLKLGSWVIGVLDVQSARPEAFKGQDLAVLSMVADQVASVLQGARLYEATRQRVAELSLLYDATVAFSTAEMDLTGIIALVMKRLIRATGVDGGRLALWDRGNRRLVTRFASGTTLPESVEAHFRSYLVSSRKPLPLYPDEPRLDRAVAQAMSSLGIESALYLPLVAHNRVIGLVELVIVGQRRRFGSEEIRLALTLGTQAAIALENARLYQETKRAVEELTALQALALDITAQVALPELLDRLMMRARNLLRANGSAIHLLETGRPELVLAASEWPDHELDPGLLTESLVLAQQVVADVRPLHQQVRRPGRGPQRQMQCACVPLRWREQVVGVLSVYRGGSARESFAEQELYLLEMLAPQAAISVRNVQLYEQLEQGLRDLEQAQASLIQAEKAAAIGRLAASLAHEINNPLQSLNNCLHLSLRPELAASKKTMYLGMAQDEVERLIEIVNRMLNFYRPATGETQVEAQVNQLLTDVLALVNRQLEHNKIETTLELAEDLPAIQAIPNNLRQVFLNLILNALDAMPEGGTLRIGTRALNGEEIGVTIADSGRGIPPEELGRIYEPFFTTKPAGTGLGLAISYGIIEAHNGRIEVESTVGRGTTFVLRLPVGEAEIEAGQR